MTLVAVTYRGVAARNELFQLTDDLPAIVQRARDRVGIAGRRIAQVLRLPAGCREGAPRQRHAQDEAQRAGFHDVLRRGWGHDRYDERLDTRAG